MMMRQHSAMSVDAPPPLVGEGYAGKSDIPVDTVIRFQDGTTQRIRTTLRVVDLGHDPSMAEAAE